MLWKRQAVQMTTPNLQNAQLRKLAHTRTCGVTLIELLVVLAIIAILMALLVPMIGSIRRKAQIRATETLIASLTTALNQYNQDFDEYPASTPDYAANASTPGATKLLGPVPDAGALYLCLNGPKGDGFEVNKHHYGPYLKGVPKENLRTDSNGTLLVDAWNHPLAYLNCQAHLQAGGAANLCHNKTFDIYSVGPDGRKDALNDDKDNNNDGRVDEPAELVDDITNW
jgi:prepilin-type N-terminal cleavage/methylation domain-containing protein